MKKEEYTLDMESLLQLVNLPDGEAHLRVGDISWMDVTVTSYDEIEVDHAGISRTLMVSYKSLFHLIRHGKYECESFTITLIESWSRG